MIVLSALISSAIPTVLYTVCIWWLDRYEKEPLPLLVAAFAWGALPAVLLALGIELLAAMTGIAIAGQSVVTFALSPLIEEPLKALALLGLFRWARRDFDGPLDGIVYGALVGFGFSMTENALYYWRFGVPDALVWLRGVLFGMSHALFSATVGLALGAVRYQRLRSIKLLALLVGLAAAILLHATHNWLVSVAAIGRLAATLVQWIGVAAVLAVALVAARHERAWIRRELSAEVDAGLLSATAYAELSSSGGRIGRQWHALRAGGWPAFIRERRFQHLATLLAFRKNQLRIGDRHTINGAAEALRIELRRLP